MLTQLTKTILTNHARNFWNFGENVYKLFKFKVCNTEYMPYISRNNSYNSSNNIHKSFSDIVGICWDIYVPI